MQKQPAEENLVLNRLQSLKPVSAGFDKTASGLQAPLKLGFFIPNSTRSNPFNEAFARFLKPKTEQDRDEVGSRFGF